MAGVPVWGDHLCECEVRLLQGAQGLGSETFMNDTGHKAYHNMCRFYKAISGDCYMRELFMLHIKWNSGSRYVHHVIPIWCNELSQINSSSRKTLLIMHIMNKVGSLKCWKWRGNVEYFQHLRIRKQSGRGMDPEGIQVPEVGPGSDIISVNTDPGIGSENGSDFWFWK